MDPRAAMHASVTAGALSGLVGSVSFWIFHDLYIKEVPAVLVEGVLWGLGAGAAVGWAFQHLHERANFPTNAWGGALLALTFWLLLVPYEVVGFLFGPFTHLTRPTELLSIAPVGLLGIPFAALLGWALTHTRKAAVALGVAGGLMHFMVGGSIVYFGGTGSILLLFLWMLPTYLVAGQLLVMLRARFLRAHRSHSTDALDVNP